jgi:DNA-binding transcriptional MerR regulator
MPRRTISKAAREAGVGVETVRFYERSGVIARPEEPVEGWRQYPESAVWKIRYVKDAQKLGFSLADCKALVSGCANSKPPVFCRTVRAVAAAKLNAIEGEIRKLKTVRKKLKTFLSQCEAQEHAGRCPIFERISTDRPGEIRE